MNDRKGKRRAKRAVLGPLTILMKAPPEIATNRGIAGAGGWSKLASSAPSTRDPRALMNGPYRAPHPDSEVNSLWSMEQWDQGKSAKSMRNFGRSIGSKG